MLTLKETEHMADYKLPLTQGKKHLYKINGRTRLATSEKAKEIKELGLTVVKVSKSNG